MADPSTCPRPDRSAGGSKEGQWGACRWPVSGMRLTMKSYTYNTIFTPDGPIYGGRYDFAIYSDTMPWDPDILFYVGCKFFYPRGESVVHYCNPEVDRLIDQQSMEPDQQKRKHLVWEIERRLTEDVAKPLVYFNKGATCWQPEVKNETVMVNSIYNGWRMEDIWLDR